MRTAVCLIPFTLPLSEHVHHCSEIGTFLAAGGLVYRGGVRKGELRLVLISDNLLPNPLC